MAKTKIIIQEGQNLFDVVLQEYGTLANIFTIFADNPALDINTDLVPLSEVIIDSEGIGDEVIKTSYRRIAYTTNNADDGYQATVTANILLTNTAPSTEVAYMDGTRIELNGP
tara:strand:+ start:336 stop:674 length:339 start_codon:yes stop_codon:yes gene_type:complete